MKIVAINGSPRKDGNNAQLLEVVRKEVEAAGVEFEVLQPGANVRPCMACYNCLNTGSLKWPYLNSILTSWHGKGLHTVAAIEAGDRAPKNGQNPRTGGQMGQLERDAIQRMLSNQEG